MTEPITFRLACCWCVAMNNIDPMKELNKCRVCGHDALRARADCKCPVCQTGVPVVEHDDNCICSGCRRFDP